VVIVDGFTFDVTQILRGSETGGSDVASHVHAITLHNLSAKVIKFRVEVSHRSWGLIRQSLVFSLMLDRDAPRPTFGRLYSIE
jgi:hypothetical protein